MIGRWWIWLFLKSLVLTKCLNGWRIQFLLSWPWNELVEFPFSFSLIFLLAITSSPALLLRRRELIPDSSLISSSACSFAKTPNSNTNLQRFFNYFLLYTLCLILSTFYLLLSTFYFLLNFVSRFKYKVLILDDRTNVG